MSLHGKVMHKNCINTMDGITTDAMILVDDNGKYGFELDVPGITVPEIIVKKIEEDDDTINAIVQVSLLPDKDIELSITFDGDEFDGFLKIPFLGKVKFKDGHRVTE
jgi:hypothetical protein